MSEKFVTRPEGVALVRSALGIPLSLSTMNKDIMLGRGPKRDARYGNKDLYYPETILQYAMSRLVKRTPEDSTAA